MTWAVPQEEYTGCYEDFLEGNFVCTPYEYLGNYKRLVSGDVSGDLSTELATIKGSSLIVYHDADVHNAAVVVAEDAVDLCFVDDCDGLGTPAILFTAAGGIKKVIYDPVLNPVLKYIPFLESSATLWVNAPILRTSTDVNGSVDEIFGVAAGLRTVFRSVLQAGGFSAPAPLGFTMSYDIIDVAPLEWDGDSQTEIAVFHTNGVQVREQDGTIRMNRPIVPFTGQAVAVVKRATQTDSLAFVMHVVSSGPRLLLFNKTFPTPQVTTLGAGVGSMAAADLDADLDDDLVLASSSSSILHILQCGPLQSSPWFPEPEDPSLLDVNMSLDGPAIPSSGMVLCANLFNDWTEGTEEEDLLPIPSFALALPGPDGVRLMRQNSEREELSSSSDFQSGEYRTAQASNCPAPPTSARSQWTVVLGNGWGITNANHVEMTVRKCESDPETPDQEVFDHDFFQIPTQGNLGIIQGKVLSFDGVETISSPVDSDIRYFVEVRPVRIISGNIVRTWRWSVLGMSASCDGASWLLDLPGAQVQGLLEMTLVSCEVEMPECGSMPPPAIPGTLYIPSAVPMSEIPGGPWTLPDDP